jgi:hypothetical protein
MQTAALGESNSGNSSDGTARTNLALRRIEAHQGQSWTDSFLRT